jgi:LysR family transcriptional regulator, transcription activator of glutamate synthase operon
MGVDTEALRWFQQVADGVTVTEIAELEMVSQPGVSRALARLERELGTPLLQRTGRVLRPTRAGKEFKRHVDALLHELDDGYAAVNELVDPETGTVALAFQVSLGGWLVPVLIRDFREGHPRVQFRLEESDDALGSSLVASGSVDLEFTARRPNNPDVHWEHLFVQPLGLTVPPGHRLAGRRRIALSDLADEDFVMLHPSWALRGLTDELCAAAGFEPRVAFECDDLSVVRGFVLAGLGVAVIPAMEPGRRGRGTRTEPLIRISDEGAHREVGLAWSKSRRLLPSAELFRDYVLETGLRRLGSR